MLVDWGADVEITVWPNGEAVCGFEPKSVETLLEGWLNGNVAPVFGPNKEVPPRDCAEV